MAETTTADTGSLLNARLRDSPQALWSVGVFALVLLCGFLFILVRVKDDLSPVHQASVLPYVLLLTAVLIALGFEFVNGFHDTANAVATVIYTHSLEPHMAVVWSGFWNLVGVLTSSGAVAYSIVALLPIRLILEVTSGSGFAMIYALLVAAVLWNLFTWWQGLPVSSSHTMIGSILGVAFAHELLVAHGGGSGIDWPEVTKVFEGLVFSPVIGFGVAAGVFGLSKLLLKDPRLYKAPEGKEPPPFYVRCVLILTCTGVSFAHGSNDGQKGMGLIMLILVGTVPTAYALNHAIDKGSVQTFAVVSTQVADAVSGADGMDPKAASDELEKFVSSHKLQSVTMPALRAVVLAIRDEAESHGSLGGVPQDQQGNIRNQMYRVSETIRLLPEYGPPLQADQEKLLREYRASLDRATKYIPAWVKVAVALALSLGTMIGWKRIVMTVGERIGKTHLTYAQGASAELTAMGTILGASAFGLPVSTTHVLTAGVAGTMAVSGAGIQAKMLRNIVLAWVFTLPAAAVLSGVLFAVFNALAK